MKNATPTDAQSFLLSMGSAPVAPALPGQAGADETDRCMSIVMKTPEYIALAARQDRGEIDGPSFHAGLMDLMRKMQAEGAFGPSA